MFVPWLELNQAGGYIYLILKCEILKACLNFLNTNIIMIVVMRLVTWLSSYNVNLPFDYQTIKAISNGITTIMEPHGWSWIDQPMIGDCKDGLNVYAITEPQTISNCYRNDVLIDRLFLLYHIKWFIYISYVTYVIY